PVIAAAGALAAPLAAPLAVPLVAPLAAPPPAPDSALTPEEMPLTTAGAATIAAASSHGNRVVRLAGYSVPSGSAWTGLPCSSSVRRAGGTCTVVGAGA